MLKRGLRGILLTTPLNTLPGFAWCSLGNRKDEKSTMLNLRKWLCFALCCISLLLFSSCAAPGHKADQPITLTVWHVYGGQTESPLNDMIDRFNETVGKEQGICVQVGMVSNTNSIHESVLAAANDDPGAAELPDLFISYPKTVIAMPDEDILVDYRDYFSESELNEFIPSFLNEGVLNGRLVILPVAKSTEVLYVNKTAFDRFASATGAELSDLSTWEGLYRLSIAYAEWTDSLTPDVPGDGKTFFVHDYHFNYFQVGVESLGESFFDGDRIAFGPAFEKAWKPYAEAAISGGVWLKGGYATEPLRTGDAVVSVASSASILYYSDIVTYPDNTSEKSELIALPCPVFEDGEKLVMQRGAGFCTLKSTPEREKAAIVFLKWITEPEINTEFTVRAGYMPVTQEAFDAYLPAEVEGLTEAKYIELYDAFMKTQADYTFYTAPQLETYLDLETSFERNVRLQIEAARETYSKAEDAGREMLLPKLTKDCCDGLRSIFE